MTAASGLRAAQAARAASITDQSGSGLAARPHARGGGAQPRARPPAAATLHEWQLRWVGYLLDTQETAEAQPALDGLSQETRKALANEIAPLEIRIAARQGKLDSLLARYHDDAEHAPSEEVLRAASMALRKDGDRESSRHVLEFM